MPTCITLNSNVDFTVTALSAPQDGYTIAIAQATPTPTATPVPTSTPLPTPSATVGYDIFAWGQNSGNFGNNTAANSLNPIIVSSLDYIDLYNNYGSSWFQKTDGSMWVWGRNNFGQLGLSLGAAAPVSSPVQLGTETNVWNTFTIGNNISAGTKVDGTLWTWGNNAIGALAFNNTTNVSSPTQVGSDTTWDSAFAGIGSLNMFAIRKDGSLWVAGKTDHILGNLYGGVDVSSPVQIGSDTDWNWVYVTQYGNLLQRNDGTYWGLGAQSFGQFGLNNTNPYSSPVQIGAGYDWDSMTASNQHVAAIRSCDKSLWVCGGNVSGALGQGDVVPRSQFVQVGSDTTWTKAIACFQAIAAFTIGLKTDGTMWAFGGNSYGYLGQGNTTRYSSPVQIGTGNWLDINAGISTVFALKSQSLVPLPTIGVTLTPCATLAPTSTPIPSPSATPAGTPFPTASATPVPTASPTGTPVPTASTTPLPTASATPVPTASVTPVPTASPTGTPVPTASTTPLPTPSATPVPTSTPSPSASPLPSATPNPTPTSTPVPTATPSPSGGATPITGGADCSSPTTWPAYGSGNKYAITFSSTAEQAFSVTSASSRTIYMSAADNSGTAISGDVTLGQDNGTEAFCFFDQLDVGTPSGWLGGLPLNSTNVGLFSLQAALGVTGTFDIWIV